MQTSVEGIPVKKFDSKLILKIWFRSGKPCVRGNTYKNKNDLRKLKTTDKEFFIDLTTKS